MGKSSKMGDNSAAHSPSGDNHGHDIEKNHDLGEKLGDGREASRRAGGLLFPVYPGRERALSEVHARPSPQIETGRLLLHYAFMTEGGNSVNQAILARLARENNLPPPDTSARYLMMELDGGVLRWERHAEFSTYLWETALPQEFDAPALDDPFADNFGMPGPMIAACRIEIRPLNDENLKLFDKFSRASLCASHIAETKTIAVTDFSQNERGETLYLILEDGMSASAIGSLAKKLVEIETYRTLALLALPLAQELSSQLGRIEVALSRITSQMRGAGVELGRELFDEITILAADLEAGAVNSLYRFGASRAYGEIVEERLTMLNAHRVPGYHNLQYFLERRLAPALRTCFSIANRQDNLSRKLARAATLLRTRVEVEIEEQNRGLLASMDRRAQLQLRLQQTVEGLSVAAISYYMVGLFHYASQAVIPYLGFEVSEKKLTAFFVPVAILWVWWMVRRIRHHHNEHEQD